MSDKVSILKVTVFQHTLTTKMFGDSFWLSCNYSNLVRTKNYILKKTH